MLVGGANIDGVAERTGRTALIVAADRGDAEMVALLLASGANADMVDRDGRTASNVAEAARADHIVRMIEAALTQRPPL